MARKKARQGSRSAQRAALMNAARVVHVPAHADIAVIGGGAAGLVAAITAAEAGATVVVLERALECGRSILATGGGRCNFANLELNPTRYNDPRFVAAVCGEGWLGSILTFFRASGLRWCREEDRLYPLSRSAASVRNVLLARAQAAGVTLAPGREVHAVRPSSLGARIAYREDWDERGISTIETRCVIVASGGVGTDELAELALDVVAAQPVLCPLACEPAPPSALDGRRVQARVSLTPAGTSAPSHVEMGEVLFRSYGLSGIVIFNLSRRAQVGDLIALDLTPGLPTHEIVALADPAGRGRVTDGALDGVLDPTIAAAVIEQARSGIGAAGRNVTHDVGGFTETERVASLVKELPFVVTGPAETQHAQVTRGGLATAQFDPRTLAARSYHWLFAAGEALDVDGDCGGFNLAWAWRSGMVAGAAAARRARRSTGTEGHTRAR